MFQERYAPWWKGIIARSFHVNNVEVTIYYYCIQLYLLYYIDVPREKCKKVEKEVCKDIPKEKCKGWTPNNRINKINILYLDIPTQECSTVQKGKGFHFLQFIPSPLDKYKMMSYPSVMIS